MLGTTDDNTNDLKEFAEEQSRHRQAIFKHQSVDSIDEDNAAFALTATMLDEIQKQRKEKMSQLENKQYEHLYDLIYTHFRKEKPLEIFLQIIDKIK